MSRKRKLDERLIYFVYILFDWCAIPRYVGKGGGNPKREDDHEKKTDATNQAKNEFIEQTWIMLGEIPKIRVQEGLTEEAAFNLEIALIGAIGRADQGKGPLTNMTDGGDGASGKRSAAFCQKMAKIGHDLSLVRSQNAKRTHALRTPEERRANSAAARAVVLAKVQPRIPKLRIGRSEWTKRKNAERGFENVIRPLREGFAAWKARQTPEERSACGKLGLSHLSAEQRSEMARRRESNKSPEISRAIILKTIATRKRNRLLLVFLLAITLPTLPAPRKKGRPRNQNLN